MLMTLEEFESLAENQKLDLLYTQGVYIGKCAKEGCVTLLFQLDSFYVELFYLKYRCYIKRMELFTSPEAIDEYLQPVDIENLVR